MPSCSTAPDKFCFSKVNGISDEHRGQVYCQYVKHPYSWAKTIVYQILSNPVYLGKLVSQRYTTRSFKDKHIVERPPEEWVIVENTHEPLVDQAAFDTVQERITIKQPATWTNTDNMFRGLMICGGCNTRMAFTTRKKSKIERCKLAR